MWQSCHFMYKLTQKSDHLYFECISLLTGLLINTNKDIPTSPRGPYTIINGPVFSTNVHKKTNDIQHCVPMRYDKFPEMYCTELIMSQNLWDFTLSENACNFKWIQAARTKTHLTKWQKLICMEDFVMPLGHSVILK